MLNNTNLFDYVIIGIYFVVMIACSVMLSKFNKNDKDYFKASGKIPWPMASLSIFIGAFSSYMFVAAAGQVYNCGLPAFILFISTALGYVFAALYFAKRYRRTRVTSPMEYIEMRFGKATKSVFTLLQIPILTLTCGNLLYVLCIFISSALGIKQDFTVMGMQISGLHLSMIFTGVVIVVYTAIGGLWAVVVTDTVQFIIAMIASGLLLIYSISLFSDGGSFFANLQTFKANPPIKGYFDISNIHQPFLFTFSWIILQLFSQPGSLPMVQRCLCVPDEKAAQKSCWLAVVFFVVCPIIWIFPVFILRENLPNMASLWPHLKNPAEASYVTIALQIFPNGMIGLVISAILAASISSMAGCFNMVSVIFTTDIYHKVIDKNASPRRLMLVGKMVSVAVGVLAITLGVMLSGLADAFKTTFTIVSHTALAVAMPMILGLIFKKTPQSSGVLSMIACFVTTLSIEFLAPILAQGQNGGFSQWISSNSFTAKIFGAIFVSFFVFLISTLFYKDSSNTPQMKKLSALLAKPVSEDGEEDDVVLTDLRAYKVVAIALLFFGVPLSLCKLLGFVEDAKSINLYGGLLFLAIAGLIFWLTSERFSPIAMVRKSKIPGASQADLVASKE